MSSDCRRQQHATHQVNIRADSGTTLSAASQEQLIWRGSLLTMGSGAWVGHRV